MSHLQPLYQPGTSVHAIPPHQKPKGKVGCPWDSIPNIYTNKLVFPKMVGFPPKSSILNRVFHVKPSILGYHHFRKHPYTTYIYHLIIIVVYRAIWDHVKGNQSLGFQVDHYLGRVFARFKTIVLLRIWTTNKSKNLGTVLFIVDWTCRGLAFVSAI